MTKDEALAKANSDMRRLKAYFPFRKVWAAVHPETLEVVTGATPTMRQPNDYIRKGYEVYSIA